MLRLCLLCLCVLVAVNATSAYARVPALDVLEQPNSGKALSFDSGLEDIAPCEGASVALRPIWLKAARTFELRWEVLAAITKIESGFGCNMGPSSAGAVGWTQFMPDTWKRWGTDADGDRKADPENAVDAVFSTARYLRVTGAPADYRKAIFAYNHADWYVNDVLETAETFGSFSIGEFGELARLSRAGRKLQDRLEQMQQRLRAHRKTLSLRRAQADTAEKQLRRSEKLLKLRERQLHRARTRLNDLTLEYIDTAVGLSSGQDRPLTDDQELLAYVADADAQDAVLVYSTARSIMDDQTRRLELLRKTAASADTLRSDVQRLVAARQQAATDRQAAVQDAERLVSEQRQALRDGRKTMRRLQATRRRYAREYEKATGQDGSLNASPFVEAQYGDIDWEGKFRWPTSGPVTSKMGVRWGRQHEGIDMGVPTGTAVRASASGVVTHAGRMGGYGNLIIIRHGDGYETRYGHNSELEVSVGENVKQGELIARSGNTGRSTGPHLHFEIRKDSEPVNPLSLLPGQ